MLDRVLDMGSPIEPAGCAPNLGFQGVTCEVSVKPYPSASLAPESASNFDWTGAGSGAAPEMHTLMDLRSAGFFSTSVVIARYIVGTPGNWSGLYFSIALTTSCGGKSGSKSAVPPLSSDAFMPTVSP